MIWHAFECFDCLHYGGGQGAGTIGVVFEVRVDNKIEEAKCPLCGSQCSLLGRWPADEDGYLGVLAAIARWWRQLWR